MYKSFHWCASGRMVSDLEWEISKPSSNSGQVCYIHFCANTLGEGMNPSSPPPLSLG